MAKKDRQEKRLEHMSPGGHLGGTKFGQQPGAGNANHARPPKQLADGHDEEKKK